MTPFKCWQQHNLLLATPLPVWQLAATMIAGDIQFFLTRATVMKERRVNEEVAGQRPKFLAVQLQHDFPTYA